MTGSLQINVKNIANSNYKKYIHKNIILHNNNKLMLKLK